MVCQHSHHFLEVIFFSTYSQHRRKAGNRQKSRCAAKKVMSLTQIFRWGTHLCMSFFCLSVCLSVCLPIYPVSHQISGTVHHLIIILGTHVWNDISGIFFFFFSFFFEFWFFWAFQGSKRVNNSPKWNKRITSAACHDQNDDISRCFFLSCSYLRNDTS